MFKKSEVMVALKVRGMTSSKVYNPGAVYKGTGPTQASGWKVSRAAKRPGPATVVTL